MTKEVDFANGLRSILRHDPDVIMVGEMREVDTIATVLRAAETGHLVLATLHTGEAVQAMGRIVNSFPGEQQQTVRTQLSLILLGIIVQQLLPRKDGKGRILATEIMISTPAIRNLIREGNFAQIYSQIQLGKEFGMHTMNHSLAELYRKGLISKEVALAASPNVKELKNILKI